MKIVLHIGADKTGSTAIQQFLAQNTEVLSAVGIEYPDISSDDRYPAAHSWAAISGINVNGNGYRLSEDFTKFEMIVRQLILDPVNQNKTFVFSSEVLLKIFAECSCVCRVCTSKSLPASWRGGAKKRKKRASSTSPYPREKRGVSLFFGGR